jgi:hypothetical protein
MRENLTVVQEVKNFTSKLWCLKGPPTLVPVLNQTNLVNTPTSYLFKIIYVSCV